MIGRLLCWFGIHPRTLYRSASLGSVIMGYRLKCGRCGRVR